MNPVLRRVSITAFLCESELLPDTTSQTWTHAYYRERTHLQLFLQRRQQWKYNCPPRYVNKKAGRIAFSCFLVCFLQDEIP